MSVVQHTLKDFNTKPKRKKIARFLRAKDPKVLLFLFQPSGRRKHQKCDVYQRTYLQWISIESYARFGRVFWFFLTIKFTHKIPFAKVLGRKKSNVIVPFEVFYRFVRVWPIRMVPLWSFIPTKTIAVYFV